jgi:hypothetical protein
MAVAVTGVGHRAVFASTSDATASRSPAARKPVAQVSGQRYDFAASVKSTDLWVVSPGAPWKALRPSAVAWRRTPSRRQSGRRLPAREAGFECERSGMPKARTTAARPRCPSVSRASPNMRPPEYPFLVCGSRMPVQIGTPKKQDHARRHRAAVDSASVGLHQWRRTGHKRQGDLKWNGETCWRGRLPPP